MLITHILERTFYWYKMSDQISMNQLRKGVYTKNGELITGPIDISQASFYRAIDSLIRKNLLIRARGNVSKAPEYGINVEWDLLTFLAKNPKYAKIFPESLQIFQEKDDALGSLSDQGNVILTQTNEEISSMTLTSESNDSHQREQQYIDKQLEGDTRVRACGSEISMAIGDDIRNAAIAATQRNANARTKQKAKLNSSALEKIWHDEFKQAYPDKNPIGWLVREQAAFKKAIDRTRMPNSQIELFIKFAVRNFTKVRGLYFKHMKNLELVNVNFVTWKISEFYEEFTHSRDPNREIKRLLRESTPRKPPPIKQEVDNDELRRLRDENAALKEKVGKAAIAQRDKIKLQIRNRPTTSPEFGKWEDD